MFSDYHKFAASNPGKEIEFIKQFPGFHYYYYPDVWEAIQKQNQTEELIDFYESLISNFPQILKLYPNLSDLYLKSGNIKKATEWNHKAGQVITNWLKVKINPQSPITSPDFLIIGAQKSGTTSLYQYLCQHYQILPAIRKEVDFFSWKWKFGKEWYLSHFPPNPNPGYFKVGEASPSYLDRWDAPKRIASLFPNVKIIVILRNPADRAMSHYYHWTRINLESRPLDLAIATQIENLKEKTPWDKPNHYIARGMYGTFIKKWLEYFSADNIYVCKFERLITEPVRELNQVLSFLELPHFPEFYTKFNFSKKWNEKEIPEKVNREIIQRLNNYYKNPNNELVNILKTLYIVEK